MIPKYDLDKIKFTCDPAAFKRAVGLYENNKVKNFKEEFGIYSANVLGTHPYQVKISNIHHDHGDCNCYMGQNDYHCKHMIAVAIYAIKNGKPLSKEEKQVTCQPTCSNKIGKLNEQEYQALRLEIRALLRYIKAYTGPSKIWFKYQNSLLEGCNRMAALISQLPVSLQTSQVIVDLLIKLDKKLQMGGVDDSDGTVGTFIEEVVEVLKNYVKLDPSCLKSFKKLSNITTVFEWEEQLLALCDK